MRAAVTVLAFVVAACGARSEPPNVASTPGSTPGDFAPSMPAATSPTALDPSKVPPGRIAYMRLDADGVERYFVVNSRGEDEHALFETRGCPCIRWSADGTQIWTVTETE